LNKGLNHDRTPPAVSTPNDHGLEVRVIPFASCKGAKSFSFFFQKEALVSCSFLEKRTKKLLQMVLI
jgi:hypothetical protein